MLDKLNSGVSYTTFGCEFIVNESIIQYGQKKEEEVH
jgi:hypothetical protein